MEALWRIVIRNAYEGELLKKRRDQTCASSLLEKAFHEWPLILAAYCMVEGKAFELFELISISLRV